MQTSLLSITWTYDRGYLVAGSDRGMVSRAVAVRNGGSPLIWSADFQRQFPGSASLHASAFLWLNTKGAFQGLESLMPNDALRKLISERDPILVVFDGSDEQIRAVSRSRISSVLMNAMFRNGASVEPK